MAKVYRFSYVGHLATGVVFNTGLHYQTDVPPAGSEPAPADILTAIDGHLRTAFRACLQNGYTVDSAELREEVDLSTGDVPSAASLVVNQLGTLTGGSNILPDATTGIIKLKTDAALRSGRGYMAIPGPRNASFLADGQNFGSSWTSLLNTFAALLDDSMDLGTVLITHLNPVVYSRTRRARGLTPYTFQVVEGIVNPRVRWRRSRTTAP